MCLHLLDELLEFPISDQEEIYDATFHVKRRKIKPIKDLIISQHPISTRLIIHYVLCLENSKVCSIPNITVQFTSCM